MAISANAHDHWVFTFGLLGNIVSFMVYLAPLPTFYRVFRRKSTEGFQSIPYVVALFSAMLWLCYGLLKTNGGMLVIINVIGCFIETTYIIFYLIYAPKSAKLFTIKLLLGLNGVVYGLILFISLMFFHGSERITVLGFICSGFAVSVFAAPLSIMKLVIRTKSVEFMPISLSFFLTLCSVMWFCYGFLLHDYYIAGPNILGFTFGIAQIGLYCMYKNARRDVVPADVSLPELDLDEKDAKQVDMAVVDIDVKPVADDQKIKDSSVIDLQTQHVVMNIDANSGQIIYDIIPAPVPIAVIPVAVIELPNESNASVCDAKP